MRTYRVLQLALAIVIIAFSNCKKEEPDPPDTVTPTVSTIALSSVTSSSATGGGSISNDGGASVTARGVCWSTSANPTTAHNKTSDGSGIGSFTSSISGLSASTTYYVRAYATNSAGTAYGNQQTFTSSAAAAGLASLTTTTITSISSSAASSGGNITNNGGSTVTARGVCWNTSSNPTTSNSKTTNGSGNGSFTSSISGLSASTTYYVRAYATNSAGTAYGNQQTFTSSAAAAGLASLTTTTISSISTSTATSGGNITSNGGASVTTRGVCWSTSSNPTTSNSKTTNGSGNGSFTSAISGLSASTTYYVRAYATNSAGTAYGNQRTFTTTAPAAGLPSLTTSSVTSISLNSAVSGGNITSNGGATVTVRGVCWSTSSNPTTSNSKTTNGSGNGVFTSNITGLSGGTSYYVRAYATNSAGTAYGNQQSFTTTTLSFPPNAPSGLTANAPNPATITLSWSDHSFNETGFEIQRQHTTLSNTWVTITTVSANSTSYTHSNLSETWPGYRVRAVNGAGASSYSNEALAPAKIRIINNLYSTTPSSGNDWNKLNAIVRVRIGPSSSAVTQDGNSYERLCAFDNLSPSTFFTYADWINPAYNSTSQYQDFPVSTYGYGSTYYVYLQCGWWEYVVIGTPYWTKRVSQVLCNDGTCCCYKWAWTQITNHSSGYFVITATTLGLPTGSWNNTVKSPDEGTAFDAKRDK